MDQENKKKIIPEINEELMMNMMVDGVKKEGLQIPETNKPKPTSQNFEPNVNIEKKPTQNFKKTSKPKSNLTYGEQFLVAHSMKKRGDKSIYIRKEYHERLSRIVQVIGKDEIPLYAYLDNILEHHFDLFEEAITSDFNEHFKPIF